MDKWPELGAIELLVAVADHGSLSAAARAVGVAQPNASRSIARLERHLGLDLVQRATTGATLTASGLAIVQWGRTTLAAAHDLTDGARTLAADGNESIVVAASQTIAEHLLPAWLAGLRASHPDARIGVHTHNSHDVVDDLLAGRCDVGFVEGPHPPRGVHHLVVAGDELVLVTPPDHPWTRRTGATGAPRAVSAAQLRETPLITREPGSGTRVALEEALGSCAPPVLELPSNAAVRIAVAAGSGPAVLSRLAVADAIGNGSVCEIPVEGLDLHRPLAAVWTGPRRLRGVVADLVSLSAGRSPTAG